MGDWLHCNTCYKQPGDGRCYFLTNCGHLYCESCQSKGWTEKCLLCGTNRPSALKLSAKLTPPVDAYFSEPIKMIKNIYSQVKQVIATMEFQHHQRKRYVSQLQKIVSNQKQIVEQQERDLQVKVRAKMETMDREMAKLKEENSYLKMLFSGKKRGHIRFLVANSVEPGQTAQMFRSPSAYDRYKCTSPVKKGYSSPVMHQLSRSSSTSSFNKRISPSPGMPVVTSGRVSVRTPPTCGKMGVIPQSTPSPLREIARCTPKSVPHPIGFDVHMETPPR